MVDVVDVGYGDTGAGERGRCGERDRCGNCYLDTVRGMSP